MRKLVFCLLFLLLAGTCALTWHLHRNRGKITFLKGDGRRAVQPFAEVWYQKTKFASEYYQKQYEQVTRDCTAQCSDIKKQMNWNTVQSWAQYYVQATNTLTHVLRGRQQNREK